MQRHAYLFSIHSGLGSFAEVQDVRSIPTPFTPECEGHPLTPIAGPIVVQGAQRGDSVAIDLMAITPKVGNGVTAILKNFGVLKDEFTDPKLLACPVRDGKAWFADRIPLPLHPNLGTISTMPPQGYKPISDGIISGTGIECDAHVKARIGLNKASRIDRPIIEQADTIQVLGWGPTVEAAIEDASRGAVDFVARRSRLSREEAYMLLGITGEVRVGTSPRPMMCARLMIPRQVLRDAGMQNVL